MPKIRFKTKLSKIHSWIVIWLPKSASAKFPSRGMNMAEGTINGHKFVAPLEPDGKGSHWFQVDKKMLKGAKAGDEVALEIEPAEEWPEPHVPSDFKKALASDSKVQKLWDEVTTKAHWEWIRWIRSTKNPDTRKIRIEKSLSKLKSGMKRPCCFNQSMCTEPYVSKNGVLVELE